MLQRASGRAGAADKRSKKSESELSQRGATLP